MISPEKAAVPLPWVNKIAVINLVKKNVGEINFNFMGHVMVELYLFKETNLLCINQLVTYGLSPVEKRKIKISYFHLQNLKKKKTGVNLDCYLYES